MTSTIAGAKVAEVTYSGTAAYATYEVINSNPTVTQIANIPVAVAFDGSTVPAAGTATAQISLAPISSSATANTAAPVPRFGGPTTTWNAYTISSCPAAP